MRTGDTTATATTPWGERDLAALDARRGAWLVRRLRWSFADRPAAMVRPGRRSTPAAGISARHLRRAIGTLLAAVLALTIVPGVAGAQDPEPTDPPPTSTSTSTTSTSTTSTTQPPDTTSTTTPNETTSTTAPDGSTTTSTATPTTQDPKEVIDAGLAGFDVLSAAELELLQKYQEVLARLTETQTALLAINDQVIASQSELFSAQSRLRAAESALAQVEDRLADAQAELEVHERRLKDIAVSAYVGGGSGMGSWASLLKSQTIDELTRGRIYANAVADDQQGAIDRARQLRDQIAGLTRAAEDYERELATARDDRSASTAALEQQRLEAAKATEEAEQALKDQTDVLAAIEAERGNFLNRLAAASSSGGGIEQTLASRQVGQVPPLVTTGIFHPPVRNYRLTSLFGGRFHPLYGYQAFHAGLDMALPTGEPIRAAEDGVVVISGAVGGYGNTVVIDHGNALGTLYGHASKLLVLEGQPVKRGQVIALVGSTGNSTGPHVHWEVRVLGQPVDPMFYLGRDDGN
ncbi:MAG: peptidoglycan DD-metalloendopeptidase family protein [Acidimicrobiales bacterium]